MPLNERRQLLQATVDLYQFYHYYDMEMNWISERLPIANSTNCGKSLDMAQSLLHKHKVIPFYYPYYRCDGSKVYIRHPTAPTPRNLRLRISLLPPRMLIQMSPLSRRRKLLIKLNFPLHAIPNTRYLTLSQLNNSSSLTHAYDPAFNGGFSE